MKKTQEKQKQKKRRSRKTARIVLAMSMLLVILAVLVGIRLFVLRPYAISIDGEEVCYFTDRSEVDEVTQRLIHDMAPEGAQVKAVSTDGRVEIGRADSIYIDRSKIASSEEAAEILSAAYKELSEDIEDSSKSSSGSGDKNSAGKSSDESSSGKTGDDSSAGKTGDDSSAGKTGDDSSAGKTGDDSGPDASSRQGAPRIITVSTRMEEKTFTPKAKYIKDDTMLAGDSEIVTQSKKGKKKELISYTCVNGEIESRTVLQSEVVEKGRRAEIRKGTLGLPEGADWKTYDGDPVYRNGSEVADTGLLYLGAPYKYGGNSLTTGIDCVQFVRQMYRKYGIYLPNGHKGLQNVGIGVPLTKAQRGDIVCYKGHVAIYIGDGKIVEAVPKKGVRVASVTRKKIITIRRVVG